MIRSIVTASLAAAVLAAAPLAALADAPPAPAARTAPAAPTAPPARGARETTPATRPYQGNIIEQARNNTAFRRVVFTGEHTQLVVMSIPPGGNIGAETHPRVEQILFVQSGHGQSLLNGIQSPLGPGDVVVVPPGVHHDITNNAREPLQLYTVYSPANHIDQRVHATQAAARADTADEAFGHRVR